jgi:GAF domain-containing protein
MSEPKIPAPGSAQLMHGDELVKHLRETLDRAASLAGALSDALARISPQQPQETEPAFQERLRAAESDAHDLASRLVESENQLGRLMNLYVATYQLHAVPDPAQVRATIADISVNLLGAQQFVLLLARDETRGECEVALREGIKNKDDFPLYAAETYRGGDPQVDASLGDGLLKLGPFADSEALAVVPLKFQQEVLGVLVLLKLFEHRPPLRADDRELLDLLSAHAASALLAARLFAAKDRRLKTLESLIRLARPE